MPPFFDLTLCFSGTGSVFQERALFFKNELCFSRTGSVFQERALFSRNELCFPGTSSAFQERVLFSRNGFRFPGTGSVFQERVPFSRNGLCFPGTGSVFQERVPFSRNGLCFPGTSSAFQERVPFSGNGFRFTGTAVHQALSPTYLTNSRIRVTGTHPETTALFKGGVVGCVLVNYAALQLRTCPSPSQKMTSSVSLQSIMLTPPSMKAIKSSFPTELGFSRVGGGERVGHFGAPKRVRPPRIDGDENVARRAKLIKFFLQ